MSDKRLHCFALCCFATSNTLENGYPRVHPLYHAWSSCGFCERHGNRRRPFHLLIFPSTISIVQRKEHIRSHFPTPLPRLLRRDRSGACLQEAVITTFQISPISPLLLIHPICFSPSTIPSGQAPLVRFLHTANEVMEETRHLLSVAFRNRLLIRNILRQRSSRLFLASQQTLRCGLGRQNPRIVARVHSLHA